ncbi:hypothetical protein TorRG33x02_143360, partial [Trema orientale]
WELGVAIKRLTSNSRGSEWLQAIVRINEGLGSVFEVVSGIEKHPKNKTAHSHVSEFSLGSCGATSGRRASLRVLRCTLWS